MNDSAWTLIGFAVVMVIVIAGLSLVSQHYTLNIKGMCADFAIHDKGTGNPHVHIMLTLRPLKENGQWGAKCRKAYDLDENGQRIPDGKGGWKNHREDTTDWNDKGNVEIWRAAWAAYTNRALESAGRPERIDHRSYKRQGITPQWGLTRYARSRWLIWRPRTACFFCGLRSRSSRRPCG